MKALVWHAKEDIRYETVPDPEIEEDGDAIIKVTTCAICGSDLHLFHNFIPAMKPGDVVGHEMMGEVVEVGRGVTKLRKGERVVIPFTINCDECDQCGAAIIRCASAPTATNRSPTNCSVTPPPACSATPI